MKTPCLKCGLIHDEPTAICDGYAGIDPDETAGDTRKKAAERIRAILAAVPIESGRTGRARAAAAGAGSKTSQSTEPSRSTAADSGQKDAPQSIRPASGGTEKTSALRTGSGRMEETPSVEVPEWRREVSERLESYRNRRERQSRAAANQSVLAFRVHSRTDTLVEDAEPEAQSGAAETLAATVAAPSMEAPPVISESSAATAASAPKAPKDSGQAPLISGQAASASAATQTQRVYAPEETDLTESLSEHAFAAAVEAHETETPETDRTSAEQARTAPASQPMASEPAVVLADSATLEVHADPEEPPLRIEDEEETARLSPAASAQIAALAATAPMKSGQASKDSGQAAEPAVLESAPLAVVPAIDKNYWRAEAGTGIALPADETPAIADTEEAECGSLTSGFEAHTTGIEETVEEELTPAEETEIAAVASAGSAVSLHPLDEAPELPPDSEEPAVGAIAAAENTSEALLPGALETPETEERNDRRAALRTASRPFPGGAPERIEISVPQPVFEFSVTQPENQQPQDDALPVADLRERRCAALLDATLLAFAIAGFWVAFHMAGGEFSFSRVGAAVSVAAAFLIYAQYILLFTLVGGATPGMVLRGLRVVCFDGRPPGGVELGWRAFGYLLSAAAGMLGFLWSAWDEHGLSWHDRISQTYITYATPEGAPAILTMQ